MGCDIHIVLERRRNAGEPWVGIYSTDRLLPEGRPRIAQRDYGFFAAVAGVRGRPDGYHPPRNLPEDISPLARQEYMRDRADHHSASHMSAAEFCAIHHNLYPNASRREHAEYDLLGVWSDEVSEHRVVFWFDN